MAALAPGERRKPYLIDWRFLPIGLLRRKDALRHHVNLLGGTAHRASLIARAWFALVRRSCTADIRRAGVVFVHVPRTGGTSLCRVLYGRNLPHCSLAFWRSLGDAEVNRLPTFSLVRDPVERMVSAYRFLRGGGTQIIASSRYDPAGLEGCRSFEEFARKAAAGRRHLRSYDVLRPQCEFVCDADGRVIVDRLFPFEDLRKGAPELRRCFGIPAIPASNESLAHPVEVTPAARALVEALYADDLRLHRAVLATRGGATPMVLAATLAAPETASRRAA